MTEETHPLESSTANRNLAVAPGGRFDRVDGFSFTLTSVIALVIYLFTLAPNVTLEFSGTLSTGAFYAGVPHPPGYPLWTLYSWFFTKLLPFSNIAWRVSVGSAVAAALACGIVALIVSHGGKLLMETSARFEHLTPANRKWVRIVSGYVAGMALGLCSAVWRTAVAADVQPLSLFLFTSILCVALRWITEPQRKGFLITGFLLMGLLLTSSQFLLLMLPGLVAISMLGDANLGRDLSFTLLPWAAIVSRFFHSGLWLNFPKTWNWPITAAFGIVILVGITIWVYKRRVGSAFKFAVLCNAAFLIGLLPYLFVPLASMTNPPVNWGYPRLAEGFLHVLARGQYEEMQPTASTGSYVTQCWWYLKMSGAFLGWKYLLPAALAIVVVPRVRQPARKWLFSLVIAFLCTGPLLVAELDPAPNRQSWDVLALHFTPSWATISVLAGLGLVFCLQFVGRDSSSSLDLKAAPDLHSVVE